MSLINLPDELIQQILRHVPPISIPAVQQVSRQFNNLTKEPLLWRHYCIKNFRYWGQEHGFQQKLRGYVIDVDWEELYKHRYIIDRTTHRCLDSILASQIGRIGKYQEIVDLGYDAKDTLMHELDVGDDAEDVLARRCALLAASDVLSGCLTYIAFRYYSNSVLGYLHRTFALKEWSKFQKGIPTTLERALAAYDMFILHDREGDFDFVGQAYSQPNGPY